MAREAAGNGLGDNEVLITHAHRYWARVYVTVNTLLYDENFRGLSAWARSLGVRCYALDACFLLRRLGALCAGQTAFFGLLFAPMLGVPLPMALSPILYFGAAAIFLGSWPLAAADILQAAGHLFVSQQEYQRCQTASRQLVIQSL